MKNFILFYVIQGKIWVILVPTAGVPLLPQLSENVLIAINTHLFVSLFK